MAPTIPLHSILHSILARDVVTQSLGLDAAAAVEEARALGREALGAARGIEPAYATSVCDRAIAVLMPLGPSETLADVLRWKGSILRDVGQHTDASDCYAESLAVADAIAYKLGRAHALNCFGTIAQFHGDLKAAQRWYLSAQQLAVELGDQRLLGMLEQNLGIIKATKGKWTEALIHFQGALAAFELAGEKHPLIWVLNNLGKVYTREHTHDLAAQALDRALRIACELGDAASEAIVEENRARLFLVTGIWTRRKKPRHVRSASPSSAATERARQLRSTCWAGSRVCAIACRRKSSRS